MNTQAQAAFVGARVVDSLPFSQGGTAAEAQSLKASGIDGVALYIGVASSDLVAACLMAGLPVMGVTLANHWDGAATVAQARAMGLATGTTLFLDVEGQSVYAMAPGDLIAKINAWGSDVAAAGFVPGVYIGSPQPLTSEELFGLRVVRYWRAPARVMDRLGHLAEPSCGWCMYQAWPSRMWAGVWVDVDFIYQDYRGRLPTWTIAVVGPDDETQLDLSSA